MYPSSAALASAAPAFIVAATVGPIGAASAVWAAAAGCGATAAEFGNAPSERWAPPQTGHGNHNKRHIAVI